MCWPKRKMPTNQLRQATRLWLCHCQSIQIRVFHITWFTFWLCFLGWFATANLYPQIQQDLGLTDRDKAIAGGCSVASTVIFTVIISWLCDKIGAKKSYVSLLLVSAFPVVGMALVTTPAGYIVTSLFIGIVGASFVITQYHITAMFAGKTLGSAIATSAGWGSFGGGCANFFMPLLYTHFVETYGLSNNMAWRLCMIVPALSYLVMSVIYWVFTVDKPPPFEKINVSMFSDISQKDKAVRSSTFRIGATDYRTWILFLVYAACFGIELTVLRFAVGYLTHQFHLEQSIAGFIILCFSLCNLFARSIGGIIADIVSRYSEKSLPGRVYALFIILLIESIFLILFSFGADENWINNLGYTIFTLIMFSLMVQAAEGATFAIVPFVQPKAIGSVSGIVGAGGNIGAMLFAFAIFTSVPSQLSYFYAWLILGIFVLVVSFSTLSIKFTDEEIQNSDEKMNTWTEIDINSAISPFQKYKGIPTTEFFDDKETAEVEAKLQLTNTATNTEMEAEDKHIMGNKKIDENESDTETSQPAIVIVDLPVVKRSIETVDIVQYENTVPFAAVEMVEKNNFLDKGKIDGQNVILEDNAQDIVNASGINNDMGVINETKVEDVENQMYEIKQIEMKQNDCECMVEVDDESNDKPFHILLSHNCDNAECDSLRSADNESVDSIVVTLDVEAVNDFEEEMPDIQSIFNDIGIHKAHTDDPNTKILTYTTNPSNSTSSTQNNGNNSSNNSQGSSRQNNNSNNHDNSHNSGGSRHNGNGNGKGDGDDEKNYQELYNETYNTCTNPECLQRTQQQEIKIGSLQKQLTQKQQINKAMQKDLKKLLALSRMRLTVDEKCDETQNDKQRKNKKKNKKKKIKSAQKQMLLHTEYVDQPSYEPLIGYRILNNIYITKTMTENVIPSTICEVRDINKYYYKYMDKAVTMQFMDNRKDVNNDMMAIDFDFYNEKQEQKLYCIIEKQNIKKNKYVWKMYDKLFSAEQVKQINDKISIPQSSREKLRLKIIQAQTDRIKKILNINYEQIMMINWCNICVFHKDHKKRRIVLRSENGHFNKLIRNYKSNTSIKDQKLIPIIMFNKYDYWIEWVLLVQIIDNTYIGISFKYDEKDDDNGIPLQISGLHVDGDLLLEHHHLVSPHHLLECQCKSFNNWKSCITDIEIRDDLNAMKNKVEEIKDKYQSLKAFIYGFIENLPEDNDYESMKNTARELIEYHDGYDPKTPSISGSFSNKYVIIK